MLRRGRPADPVPVSAALAAGNAPIKPLSQADAKSPEDLAASRITLIDETAREPGGEPPPELDEPVSGAGKTDETLVDPAARQRQLRILLRRCERVLLFDFELLAMAEWPDSLSLAEARRRRDLWLFCATLAILVFLSGLTGWVPAWVAGSGFGASVLILLGGVAPVRHLFAGPPSMGDLLSRRRRLLGDARKHVAHLEDEVGLAWQCAALSDFNPALRSPRFAGLIRLSEQRTLARSLVRRHHVRLYLIFLLEADKAYKQAEQAYLDSRQASIDAGGQIDKAE